MNSHILRSVILCIAALGILAGCAQVPEKKPVEVRKRAPVPMIEPTALVESRPSLTQGGIYRAGTSINLLQDGKTYREGDLITVMIEENTRSQINSNTSTSKEQSIDFEPPELFGGPVTFRDQQILSANVNQGNEFSGEGSSTQNSNLRGNITVVVTDIMPNGNMVVEGRKALSLNQGNEFIQLTGMIRPTDVKPDNTIESFRVANAQIVYGGEGVIADANRMGWQARFFNGPMWPF